MHVAFRGATVLPLLLRHMFYTSNKVNLDAYDEWKSKTEIKGCMDIVRFIKQNTAIRTKFEANTPIYVWNGDKQFHRKITFADLHVSPDARNKQLHQAIRNVEPLKTLL